MSKRGKAADQVTCSSPSSPQGSRSLVLCSGSGRCSQVPWLWLSRVQTRQLPANAVVIAQEGRRRIERSKREEEEGEGGRRKEEEEGGGGRRDGNLSNEGHKLFLQHVCTGSQTKSGESEDEKPYWSGAA
eukprot:757719-Hanusia_phi.AAC.1